MLAMISGLWLSRLIAGSGFLAALQAAAPQVDAGTLDRIGRLGATGLLCIAVPVLWRKIQEKDALLMQNYKNMADALAANRATLEKMADTLDGIKEAVGHLTSAANSGSRRASV